MRGVQGGAAPLHMHVYCMYTCVVIGCSAGGAAPLHIHVYCMYTCVVVGCSAGGAGGRSPLAYAFVSLLHIAT